MFAAESGFERLPLEAEKGTRMADGLKAFTILMSVFKLFLKLG